jgi:LTXXQ motif family protein
LNDEQKARFNSIGANQTNRPPQPANANPTAECGANVMGWPSEQIDRVARPDDVQRKKLEALLSAAAQAADIISAACPNEILPTPTARLEAVRNRLQAMLQAVEMIQPPLAAFYDALNDDQKARFNAMGKQLFAQNQE